MTEVAPSYEVPPPRWVPALLSFVAGYIDSYTFLALFGLFVANVTGSFITAGASSSPTTPASPVSSSPSSPSSSRRP